MIEKILKEGNYCLVDVREPFELELEGAIKGAVNIPLSEFEGRKSEILNREESVLLFCKSGVRSENVMLKIHAEGKENVFNIGGYDRVKQLLEENTIL